MTTPLESLIQTGTKLWLDSIDPDLVVENYKLGATGATSNPVIVSDLIQTGRFDDRLAKLIDAGLSDSEIAWQVTDQMVSEAQAVFRPVWEKTRGNDGYVSFEVDPLLEDPDQGPPHSERVEAYVELGSQWSAGHDNRMIKVPATPAGLDALEELAARGITLNVTLVFTMSQYRAARDAVWRGAQRSGSLERFKSVYSIFVSRIDVYTAGLSELSSAAQGQVGTVNAQRIWRENQTYWLDKNVPLQQEMVFASTGTKNPEDAPWKYVAALAGSDIQTNPPATNELIQSSDQRFTSRVEHLPSAEVLEEIDAKLDFELLESTLMREGIEKFAKPQMALLNLIGSKRQDIVGSSTDN